jgi:hypothetical protein
MNSLTGFSAHEMWKIPSVVGVDGTKCYLRANVTALAAADCDEALDNADSWGYFVDESNALVTTIY